MGRKALEKKLSEEVMKRSLDKVDYAISDIGVIKAILRQAFGIRSNEHQKAEQVVIRLEELYQLIEQNGGDH